MSTFNDLGLSPSLLRAVEEQGYQTPTPIQEQAIPVILQGKDIIASAQTGTGKTAAFALPLLQHLSGQPSAPSRCIRALILTPTRELAAQVADSVAIYGKHASLRSTAAFGGVNIGPQIDRLRRGVDILIATPGRLLDLANQRAVDLSKVEILVLDEADRMLDMGFIPDVRRIVKQAAGRRQTLMFSATFSAEIRQLTKEFLREPVCIDTGTRNTPPDAVEQLAYAVEASDKARMLGHLIREGSWKQVLVFTRTKHGADRLTQKLERERIAATAIHGNKSQGARTRALSDFKRGNVSVLVATDIASRGLDIDQLPLVVNFDLPYVPEDYVHRIGRTGRAGAKGRAVLLVSSDERHLLRGIERLLNRAIKPEIVPGFTVSPRMSNNYEPQQQRRPMPPRRHAMPPRGRHPHQHRNPRFARAESH